MHKNTNFGVGFSLLLALGTACPSDNGDDTGVDGGDTQTATDTAQTTNDTEVGETTDGPMACVGTGGPLAVGEACTANADCESGVCTIYTDAPLNDDAVCAETPADCSTRVTGTVFDFSNREPVAGETVRVVAAIEAIGNPEGANPIVQGTTDAQGRIDMTTDSPVTAAIAILAIVGGGDNFLTATGIAAPVEGGGYPVGVGNHDLWVVPAATLAQWSQDLAEDDAIAESLLPLGENGGIVGLVRDVSTGEPISGAVVASEEGASSAIIRYLDDAGGFNTDATGSTGIFVILGATSTGESFAATLDGQEIAAQRAGSANNVIFTLVLRG